MPDSSTQSTQDAGIAPAMPAVTGFDIKTRAMAETIDVVITDPLYPGKRVDTGARITIYSPRSKEARRAARASATPIRIEGDTIVSSEDEFAENLLDQTIGATVAWNLTDGGVAIPCTADTVRALYTTTASAWIQGQVQAAYLDTARFFGVAKAA